MGMLAITTKKPRRARNKNEQHQAGKQIIYKAEDKFDSIANLQEEWCCMDLFIQRIKYNEAFKLQIQFYYDKKMISLPFIAWIQTDDTLSEIICNHFDVKMIKNIGRIHEMKSTCLNDGVSECCGEVIEEHEYDQYKPFYELIALNEEKEIGIHLKKMPKNCYFINGDESKTNLADPYYFVVEGALLLYKTEKVVILSVDKQNKVCSVLILSRNERLSSVPIEDIEYTLVCDSSLKCKVVLGKLCGKIGSLIGIDNDEAVVQLSQNAEVTILPQHMVVACVNEYTFC